MFFLKKIVILAIGLILTLSGCRWLNENFTGKTKEYSGYIMFYDGDKLELDDFEWITLEDKEKIKALNLSEKDMPNGYYIHNVSAETLKFDMADEVNYVFYDLGNLYVSKNQDKKYMTSSKEEFKDFLYGGSDMPRKTPFWVEVKDNKVISIKEEFVN